MENEEDYLLISGLTHFRFCRRRWALVHIEQQWEENNLTLEGHYFHERVHDDSFTELRGSVLLSRGMPVRSETLRITGQCDMVELHPDENGVSIYGREGLWRVYPVEYKHGKPNDYGADEYQLCAQALCLEEMLVTEIPEGAIYYGQTHRRMPVALTRELREQTRKDLMEMHRLFTQGYTPKPKWSKSCKNCSMAEICQPKLGNQISALAYIGSMLEED